MRRANDGPSRPLTIGATAKRVGLSVEGVRFYEKAGLLKAPVRSAGGQRLYQLEDLKRLSFVRRARDLGFTLDEVRALLRLADTAQKQSCAEARDLGTKHLADVRAKIADLRRMERALVGLIGRCAEGLSPDCPLIDALFAGSAYRR